MASGQESIPPGIFANNQFKLSNQLHKVVEAGNELVNADSGTEPTSTPQEAEIMEIDKSSSGINPLSNWRTLYIEYHPRGVLQMDQPDAMRIH